MNSRNSVFNLLSAEDNYVEINKIVDSLLFITMLFTAIFLIICLFSSLFLFFNVDKVLPFCKFIYLFIYLFFLLHFLLHLPPRIAGLIAGGEKYCKQYDFENKVLFLLSVSRFVKGNAHRCLITIPRTFHY